MAKKRGPNYSKEFRRLAVERMTEGENIEAVAKELQVPVRTLYHWRYQYVANEGGWPRAAGRRERRLRRELNQVKRLLVEKTLEADFFKGALQQVEARRRQLSGETASTPTSEE